MIGAINSVLHENGYLNETEKDEHLSGVKGNRGNTTFRRTKNSNQILRRKDRKSEKELKPQKAKKNINLDYFYDLLFTRKNLKLVHIVCHDKQEHVNNRCDESKMFSYSSMDDGE